MLKAKEILLITALSIALIGGVISNPHNVVRADKECDTPGESHGDNSPSESKLKKQTDACEMAICVDKMECSNNDKLSKSQQEKIINSADEDDEKNCMKKASKDGHGQDGLVGYEVLECHY